MFTLPDQKGMIVDLNNQISLRAEASAPSTISIYQGGTLITQKTNSKLVNSTINVSATGYGKFYLTMVY